MDKELRSVVQDAKLGKRFVDKLVRVNVLNGDKKWIDYRLTNQSSCQMAVRLNPIIDSPDAVVYQN